MRRLPRTARSLVLLVVVAGAACVAARLPDLAHWGARDVTTFLALAAGVVLAEQFQIPVRFGKETLNVSLTEALWVGVLLHSRPSVVSLAVCVGVLVGQAMRRWAPHKVAFNAGQFLLALTAAEALIGALRSTELLRPGTFVAVAVGMAAYAAINAGLIAFVISLAQGKRLGSVLLPTLPENAVHFAANTALGLAAAVMWQAAPGATPLLLLPLAMSYVAYRALLAAAAHGDRLPETASAT